MGQVESTLHSVFNPNYFLLFSNAIQDNIKDYDARISVAGFSSYCLYSFPHNYSTVHLSLLHYSLPRKGKLSILNKAYVNAQNVGEGRELFLCTEGWQS